MWWRKYQKRLAVLIEVADEWYPISEFDQVDEALKWMRAYDPNKIFTLRADDQKENRPVDDRRLKIALTKVAEQDRAIGDKQGEGE